MSTRTEITRLRFLLSTPIKIKLSNVRCLCTYPTVIINCIDDVTMGCPMIKNIQIGKMPEINETLVYAIVLLTETGIVIASVLRSMLFS